MTITAAINDFFGDTDWRNTAACLGIPATFFYPGRGDDVTEAMATCSRCPVRQQCLEFALAHNEPGVWGGTTGRERDRIVRARRRQLVEVA